MKIIRAFFFIFFLLASKIFCQVNSRLNRYSILDTVKGFSVSVYDTTGTLADLKIPSGNYQIIYRYKWKDSLNRIETTDSINELVKRISQIISENKFSPVKLICISYNSNQDFENWKKNIKTEKLFKKSKSLSVEYYNTNGDTEAEIKLKNLLSKITIIDPKGKILRWAKYISSFDYNLKK
jgi:hypothetical protein